MEKPLPTLLVILLLALCLPTNTSAADGTALWTNVFNGAGNGHDAARGLAVDGSGNVYVTGYSYGSGGNNDYATIKYSTAGVSVWTNLFNGKGNGDDEAAALAVDGSGNVYVTGYSIGSGGNYDYATIKYSTAGVPLWTNLFNDAYNKTDAGVSLVVDGIGCVYVTGFSTDSANWTDYATIKYSTTGVPVWTNLFNGQGNNIDQAVSLAVDGSGNVYVTGFSTGSGGKYDYATIKYSGPQQPFRFVTTGDYLGFTDQQFRLTLTGPAGSNAVISSSTNLQDWTPLTTNPLVGGMLTYTDTLATNFILRFYRANMQ